MKGKSTSATNIIVSILIIVILVLSYNIHNLKTTVETMKGFNLEKQIISIENRVHSLEEEMPNQNLDQFIKLTIMELNRIEDLLNKVDGLETVYGVITGLDKSGEVILDVELADTQETIKIKLAENCTHYMIAQYGLGLIDKNEFLRFLEDELKNGTRQGFTFKIVKGKAVQTYQGWGGLN